MAEKLILVIEDSTPNRNISCQILRKLGFQTIEATSGKEAMALVDQLEEHQIQVDGIISDIMMPDMDGLQFLSNLRNLRSYDSVPFMFITASTNKDFVLKARSLKVHSYLLKPLTFEKMHNKLSTLFPEHVFPAVKKSSAA